MRLLAENETLGMFDHEVHDKADDNRKNRDTGPNHPASCLDRQVEILSCPKEKTLNYEQRENEKSEWRYDRSNDLFSA